MKLLVDVLNAAGEKQGAGPIRDILSASVTRALDGAGSFDFTIAATNENASLLVNKRRVVLYMEYLGIYREIGRGIIDQINHKDSPGSYSISVSGPDILSELKYTSTLLGREFNAETIGDAVNTLVGLASGWSVDSETAISEEVISARFDGDPVLKALQILAENQGYHIRLGSSGKTLEFGAFGTATGLILTSAGQGTSNAITSNHDVALMTSISLKSETEAVATRLYPLGAGQSADASLTLEFATRTSPYSIQSTSANGRTQYYIENSDASDEFGVIEKFGKFSKIAPLSNDVGDIENGANALYDAAAAWLRRNSVRQDVLNVQVTKLTQTVRAGDKVRLIYKGHIDAGNQRRVFRDYDDEFWVLRVQESISTSGVTVSLDLSNVDKMEKDAAGTIIGAIEELRINGMRVQPSYAPLPWGPFQRDIDSTHSILMRMPIIDDSIFALERAKLFIRTAPFRANTIGAASETIPTTTSAPTGHRHTWASVLATPDSGAGFTTQTFSFSDGTNIWYFNAASNFNPGTTTPVFALNENPEHTHDVTLPAHSHDQLYGIYDDTEYPDHVTIVVNGEEIVADADPSGTGLDTVYTITAQLKPPIAAALRQTHQIGITCEGGQGSVEVLVLLWIQAIPFKLT